MLNLEENEVKSFKRGCFPRSSLEIGKFKPSINIYICVKGEKFVPQ